MKGSLCSTATAVLFLSLFLQSALFSIAQECSQCEGVPLADCTADDTTLPDGGCFCADGSQPAGCVLKPCAADVKPGAPCDSSGGDGGVADRTQAFSYKCTKGGDQCENCKCVVGECTEANLLLPPALGGEACFCIPNLPVLGCVLKLCGDGIESGCICNKKFNNEFCYGAPCPGNEDDEVIGDCSVATTMTPTEDPTDNPPDTTTHTPPKDTTVNPPDDTTPNDDNNDGGSGDDNGNSGMSVIASFSVLISCLVATFVKIG